MNLAVTSLASREERVGVRWGFAQPIPLKTAHESSTHLTRFAALSTLPPPKGRRG
jgi:hypothetical protein